MDKTTDYEEKRNLFIEKMKIYFHNVDYLNKDKVDRWLNRGIDDRRTYAIHYWCRPNKKYKYDNISCAEILVELEKNVFTIKKPSKKIVEFFYLIKFMAEIILNKYEREFKKKISNYCHKKPPNNLVVAWTRGDEDGILLQEWVSMNKKGTFIAPDAIDIIAWAETGASSKYDKSDFEEIKPKTKLDRNIVQFFA